MLGFRWEFICRSKEVVAIAIILSTWRQSCETKIPLLNAIGVCPNAASGLCRWNVFLLGTYCIILSHYSEFQKNMFSARISTVCPPVIRAVLRGLFVFKSLVRSVFHYSILSTNLLLESGCNFHIHNNLM